MVEFRSRSDRIELRADDGQEHIVGYAAVFNRASKNLGGFVEMVAPTAFNHSRGDGWPGVVARYNHEDNFLLGTTAAGTLKLSLDEVGLRYDVVPPPSRGDILDLVRRGDIAYSSFAFRIIDQDFGRTDQGYPLRTIRDAQLIDVAPVLNPAYADTTAALRALADQLQVPYDEVQNAAQRDELRRYFEVGNTDEDEQKAPTMTPFQARAALLDPRRRDPFGLNR